MLVKTLTLQEVECNHIKETLIKFNYNVARTARILGISRVTLIRKMHNYSIQRNKHGTTQSS